MLPACPTPGGHYREGALKNLIINPDITIPAGEIVVTAVRSQGAGGQHVNKVSTAITLRFDIVNSSLPEEVKKRLLTSGDHRISSSGHLIIKSQLSRSQLQNRDDALFQLQHIIKTALKVPPARKRTKPPKSAAIKRVSDKKQRSQTKLLRKKITD